MQRVGGGRDGLEGEVRDPRVQTLDCARRSEEIEIAGNGEDLALDLAEIQRCIAVDRGDLTGEVAGRLAVLAAAAALMRASSEKNGSENSHG